MNFMIPFTSLDHYYCIITLDILIHTLISIVKINASVLFHLLREKQMLIVIQQDIASITSYIFCYLRR